MSKKISKKAKIQQFNALKKDVESVMDEAGKLAIVLTRAISENAKGRYSDIVALAGLARAVALTVCAQQEVGIPFPMEKFLTLLETELKIVKEQVC
jgi:hypothetical protein